ncbi:MAG: hypothetical protein COT74_07480 [Bdellovibrionales bacterium CG10_big_fil_rev_8_21_14_0_10_45_34]|nr:MAG: hypothetical protein COT74_07480 [Bdellovibrionales bacterium CG10_big_fil_rev_8_21_14_0_10_45_34]
MKFRGLLIFPIILIMGACSHRPPLLEYTLSREAVWAAQASNASRWAPHIWVKAEDHFRKGETSFRNYRYEEAKQHFLQAKQLSERAQVLSRIESAQSGEYEQ